MNPDDLEETGDDLIKIITTEPDEEPPIRLTFFDSLDLAVNSCPILLLCPVAA